MLIQLLEDHEKLIKELREKIEKLNEERGTEINKLKIELSELKTLLYKKYII